MKLKPCPFCGLHLDPHDPDIVYPSGTGWQEEPGLDFRTYHRSSDVPQEQWCYKVVCQTHYGGCGATASGDSKSEAVANWNRRVQ